MEKRNVKLLITINHTEKLKSMLTITSISLTAGYAIRHNVIS